MFVGGGCMFIVISVGLRHKGRIIESLVQVCYSEASVPGNIVEVGSFLHRRVYPTESGLGHRKFEKASLRLSVVGR